MKKLKGLQYFLFLFIILFSSFVDTGSLPVANSNTRNRKWGYIYHGATLPRNYFHKNFPKLSVAAITGFALNSNGALIIRRKKYIRRVISECETFNVTWYPVVTFTSSPSGKKLLSEFAIRKRAVKNLEQIIKEKNCSGIHLDFEYLPRQYSKNMKLFLIELKERIPGKKISMALFPQVQFPGKWAGFHSLPQIAPLIDEAVIMCYDYHRSGSKAGPVTSVIWAEKNIQYFLKYFTPQQLWLGIPAYGYIWPKRGGGKIITEKSIKKCSNCITNRHHPSETLHVIKTTGRRTYSGYLSDYITRNKLKNLTLRYNLKGTALWRMGMEEEGTL